LADGNPSTGERSVKVRQSGYMGIPNGYTHFYTVSFTKKLSKNELKELNLELKRLQP
jgi:hypothetical protein